MYNLSNLNIKNKMCLIGTNISHSKSPELYNQYFKSNNLDFEYVLHEIRDLKSFIDNFDSYNYIAFNITIPYKIEIMNYLDLIDESARNASSSNLVILKNKKLIGFNTDGKGLFNFLLSQNIILKNKNITIIGNGGAAKSIIAASHLYNINRINIITHDISRQLYLNNNSQIYIDNLHNLISSDVIINASNAGFGNDNSSPIPLNLLNELVSHNNSFCIVDIIYNPLETTMLRFLRKNNIKNAFNGEGMLYHQFLANIEILKSNNII